MDDETGTELARTRVEVDELKERVGCMFLVVLAMLIFFTSLAVFNVI